MPNTIVTSYNRNFPRRNDGQPTTMNFIGSPEIVTAMALAAKAVVQSVDRHADRRRRQAVPARPAEAGARGARAEFRPRACDLHRASRQTAAASRLAVDPNSERLQLMEPWPAWDDKDFVDCRYLIKTKGKTTTDHISPAGPWLRYRGHLDKFSDNMFMGATNAFTGEAGTGVNVLTGEKGAGDRQDRPRLQGPRDQMGGRSATTITAKAAAASTPRCRRASWAAAAVIARSFARIHESNLKKQGLLALTFQNPADYDRIRAGRSPEPRRVGGDGARQAGRVPHQACGRDQRDAPAQPHLQRLSAGMVPQGLGAEPVPSLSGTGPLPRRSLP